MLVKKLKPRLVNELYERIGNLEITSRTIGANSGVINLSMLKSLTDSKLDELINNGMSPNVIYNYTENPFFAKMCLDYWDDVVRGNDTARGREALRIFLKLLDYDANLDLPIYRDSNAVLLEVLVDDLRSRIEGQMGGSITPKATKNAVEFLKFLQKHTHKKVNLTLPARFVNRRNTRSFKNESVEDPHELLLSLVDMGSLDVEDALLACVTEMSDAECKRVLNSLSLPECCDEVEDEVEEMPADDLDEVETLDDTVDLEDDSEPEVEVEDVELEEDDEDTDTAEECRNRELEARIRRLERVLRRKRKCK
jgi:hypothetical protein